MKFSNSEEFFEFLFKLEESARFEFPSREFRARFIAKVIANIGLTDIEVRTMLKELSESGDQRTLELLNLMAIYSQGYLFRLGNDEDTKLSLIAHKLKPVYKPYCINGNIIDFLQVREHEAGYNNGVIPGYLALNESTVITDDIGFTSERSWSDKSKPNRIADRVTIDSTVIFVYILIFVAGFLLGNFLHLLR